MQLLSQILFQVSQLHIAAQDGDLNRVNSLVKGNTDINITDENGVSKRHSIEVTLVLLMCVELALCSQAPTAMHVHSIPKFSRCPYSVTKCAQRSILVSCRSFHLCIYSGSMDKACYELQQDLEWHFISTIRVFWLNFYPCNPRLYNTSHFSVLSFPLSEDSTACGSGRGLF